MEVAIEFGEPIVAFEDGTSEHVGHCLMELFGDGFNVWVFYSSWDDFDTVALKQLLEFVTCKFTAVVMDDGDRYRVTQSHSESTSSVSYAEVKRVAATNSGHAVARSTMVSALTSLVRICSVLKRRNCTFQGPTMSVWMVAQGSILM